VQPSMAFLARSSALFAEVTSKDYQGTARCHWRRYDGLQEGAPRIGW
jgi:hypothetical protein